MDESNSKILIKCPSEKWAILASNFIGECFDLAQPYIDVENKALDPIVRFVSAQLYIDCHLSSESVLLLIREQKEWDADLIARSVMEGSLKFTYMLEGEAEEIKVKAHEYWNVLPRFHDIKHSDRARQLLEVLPNPEDLEWQPFRDLIIDESKIAEIRAEFPRQERQVLEERWSFSGICKAFASSKNSGRRGLAHLAHGYGQSSHLLHKDAEGVGMVWERNCREPHRQQAIKLGHVARVVSDVCAFSQLRLYILLGACGQSRQAMNTVEDRYTAPLFSELKEAILQFASLEYDE